MPSSCLRFCQKNRLAMHINVMLIKRKTCMQHSKNRKETIPKVRHPKRTPSLKNTTPKEHYPEKYSCFCLILFMPKPSFWCIFWGDRVLLNSSFGTVSYRDGVFSGWCLFWNGVFRDGVHSGDVFWD